MTVKELITKLQKCNPEAKVYTEQHNENNISEIGEIDNYNGMKVVYLADTLYAVEEELNKEGVVIKEVK